MEGPEDNVHTPEERIALINEWSKFFLDNTEGWFSDIAGDLGGQLAYLFAAIANDDSCEFPEDCEIIQLLVYAGVDAHASIWDFITILDPNE